MNGAHQAVQKMNPKNRTSGSGRPLGPQWNEDCEKTMELRTSILLFGFIFSLLHLPLPDAICDVEDNEDQDNKKIVSSAKHPNDDPEVYTLDTWKSKVRGSLNGEKLISMLSTLDAALVRNHRDLDSLYTRGHLYGTVGCTNAAVIDLTKVIQADPTNGKAYCERGICFFDLADYDRALRDLNKAVELDPQSGDARLARGRLLLWLSKPLPALDDLYAARYGNLDFHTSLPGELPSNFYKAPDYYLAACYEILGNYAEALKHYQAATDLPSTHNAGYLHRYAEQPVDTADCINRLSGQSVARTQDSL